MSRLNKHLAPPGRPSPVSSQPERELKLAVAPDFRLPRLPGTPLPRRQLISTYYDTTAYDLAHARMTFRHRIERGKKAWQLKIPLGDDRQEVEVSDGEADPPASVSVGKNGRTIQRFRELEIEQRQSDEASLRSLEQQLREAGASDHDGRPKFFRALSLPAPIPPRQPEAEAPVVDYLKWALAQHVGWLVAHDPGTRLGTEPESLHQLRVATRRLRAVLHTARPILLPAWATSLQQELEWLGELLGPARDLDVQIAYFSDESTRLDARDRKLLAQFISHLHSQREAVQQMVLSELTSARYVELIRRLQQAAQAPSVVESPLTVHQLAKRAFKKLPKAIRGLTSAPSDATLHKIRIKTKRARYAAELARSSAGKPASRFLCEKLVSRTKENVPSERIIRERNGFEHLRLMRCKIADRKLDFIFQVRNEIAFLFRFFQINDSHSNIIKWIFPLMGQNEPRRVKIVKERSYRQNYYRQ